MKQELRKIAKEKRNNIYCDVLNIRVIEKLCLSQIYKNAKNIMTYYSIGSEVSTVKLLNDATKNWYLPRIDGDNLLICPYSKNKFFENKYKILEPTTNPIDDLSIIDMVIIPAICADKNGYRIGYGKGYYDRFLKKLSPSCTKVILTFYVLFYDSVFPDTFDVCADYVVTDISMYKI